MQTKIYSRHYTKEQKQEYLAKLRNQWKESKSLADSDKVGEALFRESGLNGVSYYSFMFVHYQMKQQGLDGLPYIDMKTFRGWKESGFRVQKGESSLADGITWIGVGGNEEDNIKPEFFFPKVYRLFHRTQTDCPAIAA